MNPRVAVGLVRTAVLILGFAAIVFAVGGPVGAWSAPTVAPDGPVVPQLLSATGLYAADGTVDPANQAFAPQYPLWSDGAVKRRWIHLPPGTRIDVSDLDAWRFPVGTRLWKEFAWDGRRIETRMIWQLQPGQWEFATYVWNREQTDAELAPPEGLRDVLEVAPGRHHSIPGQADCRTCHLGTPAVVLGFNALQLSDDRDPRAPHAEPLPQGAATLRTLVAEDRLEPPRPELVRRPPRIRSFDPDERAALGYLAANCGGCHNADGPLARLGLVLQHDAAGDGQAPEPGQLTTVDQPGRYPVPDRPADSTRVVAPGEPGLSALLYRMESRRPSAQMPPLGTVIADEEAVALVRRWIAGLKQEGAQQEQVSSRAR